MIKTLQFDDGEDLGRYIDHHGLASTATIVVAPSGFTLSFEAPEPDHSLPPMPWTYKVERAGSDAVPNYRYLILDANGSTFTYAYMGPSELRAKRMGALLAGAPKMLDELKRVCAFLLSQGYVSGIDRIGRLIHEIEDGK